MLRTKENHLVSKIENALQANLECAGNLLLPNRVFQCMRKGKPELLVSLNNKMQRPHYWGHVFWYEGNYISLIMAVDYWLNPASKDELFNRFWDNLEQKGKWYPIGGDVFEVKEDFDDACESLARMINNFAGKMPKVISMLE